MWKRPKYLRNLHESAFIMFFIILGDADFENASHTLLEAKLKIVSVCLLMCLEIHQHQEKCTAHEFPR